jgi:hypothetical protein
MSNPQSSRNQPWRQYSVSVSAYSDSIWTDIIVKARLHSLL